MSAALYCISTSPGYLLSSASVRFNPTLQLGFNNPDCFTLDGLSLVAGDVAGAFTTTSMSVIDRVLEMIYDRHDNYGAGVKIMCLVAVPL